MQVVLAQVWLVCCSMMMMTMMTIPTTMGWDEQRRLSQYRRRNYTWPISDDDIIPNTRGWKSLMKHRLRQVEEIEDGAERFEGFAQTLTSALLQPNYTEHGFALARAPDDLMEALRQGIRDGLKAGPSVENDAEIVGITGDKPWFINRPDLTERVIEELHHYPETWSNMELTPFHAYGFRLYRNQSSLFMHVDKTESHIISFILHIDSSDDAEPWPILIEDFQGTSHEVTLTSGDILLYESSKCFHGRPRQFNGSWYSSVFVHYHPKYNWKHELRTRRSEKFYLPPPSWSNQPTTHYEIPLRMHQTYMYEPTCPNGWCDTTWSNKWSGPGKDGHIMLPNGDVNRFEPRQVDYCVDKRKECEYWASWDSNECVKNKDWMEANCRKTCNACGTPIRSDM